MHTCVHTAISFVHICAHTTISHCSFYLFDRLCHLFTYVYIYSHMCTFIHTCVHLFTYVYIYSHMCPLIHTCLHTAISHCSLLTDCMNLPHVYTIYIHMYTLYTHSMYVFRKMPYHHTYAHHSRIRGVLGRFAFEANIFLGKNVCSALRTRPVPCVCVCVCV